MIINKLNIDKMTKMHDEIVDNAAYLLALRVDDAGTTGEEVETIARALYAIAVDIELLINRATQAQKGKEDEGS